MCQQFFSRCTQTFSIRVFLKDFANLCKILFWGPVTNEVLHGLKSISEEGEPRKDALAANQWLRFTFHLDIFKGFLLLGCLHLRFKSLQKHHLVANAHCVEFRNCLHSAPEVSKVEGALSEREEVFLLQVVEDEHVAGHVRRVRSLLVDEVGGEDQLLRADASAFEEAGGLLLHRVDEVVDQPREYLLLVPQ